MANIHGYFHPETEDYKFWTQQEDAQFEQYLKEGKGYREIGRLMNRSYQSCMSRGSVLGLKCTFVKTLYDVNHNFWNPINEINSYWAGFSAADSSIQYKSEKSATYTLELSEKDRGHLEKLKTCTKSTGEIYSYTRKPRLILGYPSPAQTTNIFKANSYQWYKDLKNNFGVVPDKTHRIYLPVMDKLFQYLFLIGYVDGDGTIFKDKKRDHFTIKFVSSSEAIINAIEKLIRTDFGHVFLKKKEFAYKKVKNKNCYLATVNGLRACVVFDFLSTLPAPYKLDRKWKQPHVLDYVNKMKTEFPDLFTNYDKILSSQPFSV